MPDALASIRALIGNPNAYARQQTDGAYLPVRSPLTDARLAAHLEGADSIGTYVLNFDKARTIVFDDDTDDLPLARRLQAVLKRRGLSSAIERSGGKGYHVWVVFDQYAPAADLRRIAAAVADEAGFTGEVFPKQDAAKDLGNLVKLPLGVHAKTGERSAWIGAPVQPQPVARVTDILADMPPVSTRGSSTSFSAGDDVFPCMASIQNNPPGEGERHNCLIHFITMLRRTGLSEQYVSLVASDVAARCDPPYDQGDVDIELDTTVGYPNACGLLPPERRCPDDRCVRSRSNIRAGAIRMGGQGERVSVVLGDRDGDVVELQHPDLAAGKAALS